MISHTDMREFIAKLDLDEADRAILERYRSEQALLDEVCDPVRTARLAEQQAFSTSMRVATLETMLKAALSRIASLESAVQELPTLDTVVEVICQLK